MYIFESAVSLWECRFVVRVPFHCENAVSLHHFENVNMHAIIFFDLK